MPVSLALEVPAAGRPLPGVDWRLWLLLAAPLLGLALSCIYGVDAGAWAPQM